MGFVLLSALSGNHEAWRIQICQAGETRRPRDLPLGVVIKGFELRMNTALADLPVL
jgi:hypothetical protein